MKLINIIHFICAATALALQNDTNPTGGNNTDAHASNDKGNDNIATNNTITTGNTTQSEIVSCGDNVDCTIKCSEGKFTIAAGPPPFFTCVYSQNRTDLLIKRCDSPRGRFGKIMTYNHCKSAQGMWCRNIMCVMTPAQSREFDKLCDDYGRGKPQLLMERINTQKAVEECSQEEKWSFWGVEDDNQGKGWEWLESSEKHEFESDGDKDGERISQEEKAAEEHKKEKDEKKEEETAKEDEKKAAEDKKKKEKEKAADDKKTLEQKKVEAEKEKAEVEKMNPEDKKKYQMEKLEEEKKDEQEKMAEEDDSTKSANNKAEHDNGGNAVSGSSENTNGTKANNGAISRAR